MVKLDVKRTEKEYRALDIDSYSSLKEFADNRRKYYKKYYIGESLDEEEDTKATLIGTLVETLELEGEEEFDNKFYKSITTKSPTPSVMKFIDALYKRTIEATDDEGVITRTFLDMAKDAYNDAGIKKPGFDVFMRGNDKSEGFIGSEDELYYKQLREVKPMNKKIVSLQDIENAHNIQDELHSNALTKWIFEQENDDGYTVYNQLQIDEYELDGLPLKSMYDKIIASHREKYIQFYDLKCTWSVENFYEEYYLYRRSYIQAYLYWYALDNRLVDLGFDYKDYEILYPIFIVVDSINNMKPLLYKLDYQDIMDAYDGFTYKNKYYVGVKEIIQDLKWAKENNEWRISRYAAEKGGIIPLKKAR